MAGIAGVGNVGGGVTSSRSTGSNTKEPQTTKNTSSSSSSNAAVKAASPTTSVGSNTRDTSSSADRFNVTPSSSTQTSKGSGTNGSGGIAAAASVGAGVTPSSSTQTSRGNGLSAVSSRIDPVGDTPAWLQLQDQIDMLTPGVAHGTSAGRGALSAVDVPGSSQNFANFAQNVQNGSLGVPRAAGYGLNYDPTAQIAFDPMAQDTAAMDRSLAAPTGIDLAALAHSLNGPYLARQAANGGVPPFEGAVDWAGIAHALNGPYLRRVMQSAAPVANGALPEPVTREVQTVPIHASEAKPNDWPNAWARLLDSSDRLPATPVNTDAVAPAYTGDSSVVARTVNPDGSYSDPLTAIQVATADNGVPLPRRDPRTGGVPITVHGSGAETDYGQPGLVTGDRGGPTAAPSTWDKIVDNGGKILSHTGLGALVSGIFPDLWNGMGENIKSWDNGGIGTQTKYPDDMAYALSRLYGDPHSGQGNGGTNGAPAPAGSPNPGPGFPDVNHNGIDDRLEGLPGTDAAGFSGNQFRSNRYATFPDMPPYRPGVDDEWNYFHDHLARGGVVGYAERDPRVSMIADAEDALHRGDHGHPSLDKFVDTFGPKALENLNNNVRAGYRMRAGRVVSGPGGPTDDAAPAIRMSTGGPVVGPGGPTEDAVPAMIDGQHPAKLSSGEFVLPVSAVESIGGGDHSTGVEKLQNLLDNLGAKKKESPDTKVADGLSRVILDNYSYGASRADANAALAPSGWEIVRSNGQTPYIRVRHTSGDEWLYYPQLQKFVKP